MWAQLIKARVKPGKQGEVEQVQREFERRGADGSTGWVRSIGLQNQNDPDEYYNLVFFESEEKARANERNPEQQEMVQRLMNLFEGQPSYVDLIPIYEGSR
jgi:heme-degrading monooxygenase HmoA